MHFVARVHSGFGNNPGESGPDVVPIGAFFGARYRLEENRLVVHWGELAPTAEEAALPPPISEGEIGCNGEPYYCYGRR